MGSINHKIIVISAVTILFAGACTVEPTDQAARIKPVVPLEQEDLVLESDVRLHEEVKRERMQVADALVMPSQANSPRSAYKTMQAYDLAQLRVASEPLNRENYAHFSDNPLQRVAEDPFSTFSIDVDTGSYIALPD